MSELDAVAAALGISTDPDPADPFFREDVEAAGGPDEAAWVVIRRTRTP